jgi:hypothetical protein
MSVNSRKPKLTNPSTPITRPAKSCGRWRLKIATARVQAERIHAHNSSDPSCAPQSADTR